MTRTTTRATHEPAASRIPLRPLWIATLGMALFTLMCAAVHAAQHADDGC